MNFSKTPKTPTRSRSKSTPKSSLMSTLDVDFTSLSLGSPTKARRGPGTYIGDVSNPFLSGRSRPASPVKKASGSGPGSGNTNGKSGFDAMAEELKRQASMGVLRKGSAESRMNVVKMDYNLPRAPDMKRSKSQPATKRDKTFAREPALIPNGDRFISVRDDDENLHMQPLQTSKSSPGHLMRLSEATGLSLNKRVLAFHEAPPQPSADKLLESQRAIAGPLFSRPTALGTSTNAVKNRKIRTAPERVLDAPGIVDDYYLNLVDWSSENVVAVGLAESAYIWRADQGTVSHVTDAPESCYISSLQFSNDGAYLAVAFNTGSIELWDVEANKRLRTMHGRQAQVAVMSWNQHLLSSGCQDGAIWHHDVRISQHKVMELIGHNGEVCGLQWRPDGELLASGGNDNVVNIWDGRTGDVLPGGRGAPKWTKRNHTAAVKAVAWCPWQPALLATGGGTGDATINIWNSTTGARIQTTKTPAQVTSIRFSPHRKEFVSTHGLPTNAIMVHAYPSMEAVAEIRDAHDARVLYSGLAPDGEMVVTAAADENLKFWKIWEAPPKKKVEKNRGMLNSDSILSLR